MNISKETKIVLHIEDGYYSKLEICDNPDAPEIAFNLLYSEEGEKPFVNLCLNDEMIPHLVNALESYIVAKKGKMK